MYRKTEQLLFGLFFVDSIEMAGSLDSTTVRVILRTYYQENTRKMYREPSASKTQFPLINTSIQFSIDFFSKNQLKTTRCDANLSHNTYN